MPTLTARIDPGVWALFLVIAAMPGAAGDWPGWRGPSGDGTTDGAGVFDAGPFGLETAWVRPLGSGYAGIAVAEGLLVTLAADGGSDHVVALDARTGKERWRHVLGPTYAGHDGSDDGPSSTPVIQDGVVYALGPKGLLLALRTRDGTKIWARDLVLELGAREPRFGFATTPLLLDELLYVEAGGSEGRLVAALDKRSGATVWSAGGDDRVGYHSPAVLDILGSQQLVVLSTRFLTGFDPSTGSVLWRHEWAAEGRDGSTAKLVPLGHGAVLIHDQPESIRVEVTASPDGFRVQEVWRDDNLKARLSSPVYLDGHLYGFDGRFLSCVEAQSGKEVWKSRPPGGTGLVAVDRHLLILGAEGAVVVAQASPAGYREEARRTVLAETGVTYPAFADGMAYVRNVREIAALRVGPAPEGGGAAIASGAPGSRFEAFVRRVEAAPDKRLLVDAYFAEPRSYPIVEDGRFVHFVYRGAERDVGITGTMTRWREELTLARVAGTDLYHRSFPLDAGLRWEYQFNVDFDRLGPDPLNPRRVPSEWYGDQSELLLPGYVEPAHVKPYSGSTPGRTETLRFESAILANERDVQVYLPAGYDVGERSYPLVVVQAGDDWLAMGHLPNTLDHLVGAAIEPVVVAFVAKHPEGRWSELGGEKTAEYVRMLADELVPWLEARFRLRREAGSRATFGTREAGAAAIWAGIARPDVFGAAAVQSFERDERLAAEIDRAARVAGAQRARFFVQWNRDELRGYSRPYDLATDGRELVVTLERNGYRVTADEAQDSSGWGGWRAQVDRLLVALVPFAP